jgi:hypothetical protein
MRIFLLSLIVLSMVASISVPARAAGEWPKEGQVCKRISVDLDGKGGKEQVLVQAYAVTEEDYWLQVLVLDSRGKKLWASPRTKDSASPYAFGAWMYGVCDVEIVADIDRDGRCEMVSPEPISDVRAPVFRVFRWSGKQFTPAFKKRLVQSDETSGLYIWSDGQYTEGRWVARFKALNKDGTLSVGITQANADGYKSGTAAVASVSGGFTFKRWLEPLKE